MAADQVIAFRKNQCIDQDFFAHKIAVVVSLRSVAGFVNARSISAAERIGENQFIAISVFHLFKNRILIGTQTDVVDL